MFSDFLKFGAIRGRCGSIHIAAIVVSGFLAAQLSAQPVTYEQAGQILKENCYGCHGDNLQTNGLRLDRKREAFKGGHSGPAIQPGDSAKSLLIRMLTGDNVPTTMPPGRKLDQRHIDTLRAWIDQGAIWPEDSQVTEGESAKQHWAFRPIRKPTPPPVKDSSWTRNPIDQFVLARLESDGLEPAPEADESTLTRRVNLDLVGLPRTPDGVTAAAADTTYESRVEELLRSAHYGEKWAGHWLDQVRYADSDGYEKDLNRRYAWRYREWVIDALNADMPFDQFTNEQIAGDLLPDATPNQMAATGFYRNSLKNREGGVSYEQFRFEEMVDRANTISTVWLGITTGCAQCHDHKFDPIKQVDYYRLLAFLNTIEDEWAPAPMSGEMGAYLKTHNEYRERREELLCEYDVHNLQAAWEPKVQWHGANPGHDTAWDVNWDTLAKMSDGGDRFIQVATQQRTERQADVVNDYFLRFYSQVLSREEYKVLGFAELREKLASLEQAYPQLTMARVVEEGASRKHHLHVRGQWDRKGIEVSPATPDFLPPLRATNPNRLDLAQWLTSTKNPLTARVIVNRAWQEFFGTGLVATSDDFGTQGEAPSHPDLLDWLASDFVESGWSLKHLHRRIVTSATYRQASDSRPDIETTDPNNRLLSRQRRLRLSAEAIRDSALLASGLLNTKIGGPSIRPPLPDGVVELSYGGGVKWDETQGPEQYRRGLYIHFQRSVPYPFLMTFDGTERTATECSRERSNTPLQALNLLNDPVFFEAAQGLAAKVLLSTPDADFERRLNRTFELALSRPPSDSEFNRLQSYFGAQKKLLDESPGSSDHWFPADLAGVDRTDAAAWTGLARVVLNLDEFITRE